MPTTRRRPVISDISDLPAYNNSELTEKLKQMDERLDILTKKCSKRYHVLSHYTMDNFVENLRNLKSPYLQFPTEPIKWKYFDDGTDKISIPDLKHSSLADKHILFIANFENNAATLSQFHVLTYLCELRIKSLTILMPFFPTGTTERVADGEEDIVPTANTLAQMLSNLPRCGPPVRVMTYDIHALQEQFYFSNNAVADLRSAIPSLIKKIRHEGKINCIAFPDDGAKKRFGKKFNPDPTNPEFELVICGKERTYDGKTNVNIQDGDPSGKHVLIVDDQTKSGGTIFDCVRAIQEKNPLSVSAYVTHAVFTDRMRNAIDPKKKDFWETFNIFITENNQFGKFYVTDSVPGKMERIKSSRGSRFEFISLAPQVLEDLIAGNDK